MVLIALINRELNYLILNLYLHLNAKQPNADAQKETEAQQGAQREPNAQPDAQNT
jgi:hypothetical protein